MPASVRESVIRDEIASRLQLIESGLKLVQIEFRFPNAEGAGGTVDILATDSYGHRVLIEIKKSNKTAREALHELHKYVALLRAQTGLSDQRIRCILVSTDWHELLVPFSEFAGRVEYSVEGIRLEIDDAGRPVHLERVRLVKEPDDLVVCRVQHSFFFRRIEDRDAAVPLLEAAVAKAGVTDYLILLQEYGGTNEDVMPYAQYLVFPKFGPGSRDALAVLNEVEIDAEEEAENPDLFEEMVACRVIAVYEGYESYEIGYPDKFLAHAEAWKVTRVIRHGRFGQTGAQLTDEELLTLLMGLEGGNNSVYQRLITPRFQSLWLTSREAIQRCLLGSSGWSELIPLVLAELEVLYPAPEVGVSIFNPADLLEVLYWVGKRGDGSSLPGLEIVASQPGSRRVVVIHGGLVWDGHVRLHSPESTITSVFGEVERYFWFKHFNEQWSEEGSLMTAHGLSYELVEYIIEGDERVSYALLREQDGQLLRLPFPEEIYGPMQFAAAHQAYLSDLVNLFDGICFRLIP